MKRFKHLFVNRLAVLIALFSNLILIAHTNECPICGTSKIVKCIRLNKTSSSDNFHNINKSPDFKCTCKYVESDDKSCKNTNLKNLIQQLPSQNQSVLDIEKIKTKEQTSSNFISNECLNVYVGK